MILSTLLLAIGFAWLMVETNWLRIRLPYGSIPVSSIERRKHSPRIELGEVKACSYPEPEAIKLLPQYCYVTKLEHELTRKYFRSFATGKESYQTMSIGGNLLTVNSHNPKLYDVIAEAVKVADSKDRKPALKLAPINWFNPLCGKEWYNAHINDHKDFEPTIQLTVNEKSISFNGDFRTGKIHDFCVLNAELWERPRIKGKKIKVEAN